MKSTRSFANGIKYNAGLEKHASVVCGTLTDKIIIMIIAIAIIIIIIIAIIIMTILIELICGQFD